MKLQLKKVAVFLSVYKYLLNIYVEVIKEI